MPRSQPIVFTAGPAPTVTTSYSITSRSCAATSIDAKAEKHRARVLPHTVALLQLMLLLLVALVALKCGFGGANAKSVEVPAVVASTSSRLYLRPQRFSLPARKIGNARRKDSMLCLREDVMDRGQAWLDSGWCKAYEEAGFISTLLSSRQSSSICINRLILYSKTQRNHRPYVRECVNHFIGCRCSGS